MPIINVLFFQKFGPDLATSFVQGAFGRSLQPQASSEGSLMTMIIKKDWLTIGEVSDLTGVPIHTLRYWESEFSGYFSPLRTSGRQRRYNDEAVDRVLTIKSLLKEEKYSIAGAKQVLERQFNPETAGIIGAFAATMESEGQNTLERFPTTTGEPN
jgi:DNA-binding transcriptional MerR regulator